MALPTVSGEFRVVDDPSLNFAASGMAIGKMRIVANSRKKNESTGEWEDDKVVWLRATAFKKVAENMAESFVKGDLVLITGRLETQSYEKDGEKRQSYEVLVDTIGPSIQWNPAKVERTQRSGGGQGSSQSSGGGGARSGSAGAPASEDPWAAPQSEEPPF